MSPNSYLKSIGTRILCELNDLKRTPETAAKELGLSIDKLKLILNGCASEKDSYDLIRKMGQVYPIDHLHLHLLKDDTINGVKFVSSEYSKESKRVYNRSNKDGRPTEYYEYRDTAMSKLSLFKPEWISVLREVEDSNPNNPDVIMNNGHFMHQVTLFIGPVNFYYEDESGTRYCCEMNTGDSNYITPFVKHSFASRNEDEFTCILAVTFGADVCRAQRELYALGHSTLESYIINDYDPRHLIKQFMYNNFFTIDILDSLVNDVDIKEVFSSNRELSYREIREIANVLGVSISDIMKTSCSKEEQCVIKYIKDIVPSKYSNKQQELYDIYTLARTPMVPSMTNSIIRVLTNDHDMENHLQKSLHSYIINFGSAPVELMWEHNDKQFTKIINKFDSVYLKPFIKFSFANKQTKSGKLMIVGIPSSINTQTQKELSAMIKPNRVINELETWYEC